MTLKKDFIKIINQSQARTWRRFESVKKDAAKFGLDPTEVTKWKTPGEPALVYGLIDSQTLCQLGLSIREHLTPSVGQPSPIVSSIFIHQKPKVRFKKDNEAEIGDLLLVRQHFQAGNPRSQGRAMLLQAKMSAKPRTGVLKGNDAVQFSLYNGWNMLFRFPNKEVVGREKWNFAKGSPSPLDETGVYAIGYKHEKLTNKGFNFPDGCCWSVGKVPFPLMLPQINASTDSLATVLEKFVSGNYGREWSPVTAGNDDHWSDFVMQMLTASTSWKTRLQRIGKSGISRRRPDIQAYLQTIPAMAMATVSPAFNYLECSSRRDHINNVQNDLIKWASTIGVAPPEMPPVELSYLHQPSKGMSVLYVGTFSEHPLSD